MYLPTQVQSTHGQEDGPGGRKTLAGLAQSKVFVKLKAKRKGIIEHSRSQEYPWRDRVDLYPRADCRSKQFLTNLDVCISVTLQKSQGWRDSRRDYNNFHSEDSDGSCFAQWQQYRLHTTAAISSACHRPTAATTSSRSVQAIPLHDLYSAVTPILVVSMPQPNMMRRCLRRHHAIVTWSHRLRRRGQPLQ